MSRFEPILLEWNGVKYTVPPEQVMRAIALIEDHITFGELLASAKRGATPLGKISAAYTAVLNLAGANLLQEDVYAGMFGDVAGNQQMVINSVVGLMGMMIPPDHLQRKLDTGKATPAGRKVASSKPRGKRRSGRSG